MRPALSEQNSCAGMCGGLAPADDKIQPVPVLQDVPEIIRLAVMMYVRFPLSLRNVEDLLHERGIEVSPETVWFWWNRFGPLFAAELRKRRVSRARSSRWRWHLDEAFVNMDFA